jgi:hypothetical protein
MSIADHLVVKSPGGDNLNVVIPVVVVIRQIYEVVLGGFRYLLSIWSHILANDAVRGTLRESAGLLDLLLFQFRA